MFVIFVSLFVYFIDLSMKCLCLVFSTWNWNCHFTAIFVGSFKTTSMIAHGVCLDTITRRVHCKFNCITAPFERSQHGIYTPMYEKGIKKTQNKSMETTDSLEIRQSPYTKDTLSQHWYAPGFKGLHISTCKCLSDSGK